MNAPDTVAPPFDWPEIGPSRVPYPVYTDPALYREELERFFYRGHWCYVGLEAEIPEAGRLQAHAWSASARVIMVRDADGAINVVENRCAHRGVAFCRERHGNRKDFVCPYHQWSYDLDGNLQGVPFRRGVQADGEVQGGMPADFELAEHGLDEAEGRASRRRGVRVVRPRRRAARGLPRARGAAVLRPRVQRPQAARSSATPASASRATGS